MPAVSNANGRKGPGCGTLNVTTLCQHYLENTSIPMFLMRLFLFSYASLPLGLLSSQVQVTLHSGFLPLRTPLHYNYLPSTSAFTKEDTLSSALFSDEDAAEKDRSRARRKHDELPVL